MQELKQKLPFVGPSGEVLDKSLMQVPHVEPYYLNAMQCFPGYAQDKKQDLIAAGVSACRERVLKQIAAAPRKVILALGAPALWSITGDYDHKITFQRGRLFPTNLASNGCIPSVHPAFLMRGGAGASFQQYMRDVKYGLELWQGKAPKSPPQVKYEFVRDERDIKDVADYFKARGPSAVIAGDIETTGFSFLSDDIICAGFAIDADEVFGVPRHLLDGISPLLDAPGQYMWHGGKFDVKFLWRRGFKQARIDEDSMLMSYVLDENGGIHDLETVASDWLGSPNWKAMLDGLVPKKVPDISYPKGWRPGNYGDIPRDTLHHYMCLDIGNTRGLYDVLRPIINSNKHLTKAYERTLIPGANFLAKVETRGLYVDLERVHENTDWYTEKIDKHRIEFYKLAQQFPDSGYTEKLMNSPKQMVRLLYDDLKIVPYKKQRTTDKKVLEKLPDHPALRILRNSRKDNKEYGTYVKSVAKNTDVDGCVHTTYKQHGTRTGRLASGEPNVQNVPRNPRIRGQYIARPGRRFLEPDLNQAELRALACFSNDPGLCHIYETAGMSLHDELRATIWGYPKDWRDETVEAYLQKFDLSHETRFGAKGEDRIMEEQKMRAKAVNFGIPYGRESFSIAEEFMIKPAEAQGWINAWFKKFPEAKKFLDQCRDVPMKGQVLINNFGFYRRFGVVGKELVKGMQNEASNFPCQSCASHITLHAAVELENEGTLAAHDAYVCNLVHDSILFDVPDDDDVVASLARIAIAKMEDVPKRWGFTRIPFVAEAKMGNRWGSLSKYSPPKLELAA
jgi:DNA polymerase-1